MESALTWVKCIELCGSWLRPDQPILGSNPAAIKFILLNVSSALSLIESRRVFIFIFAV